MAPRLKAGGTRGKFKVHKGGKKSGGKATTRQSAPRNTNANGGRRRVGSNTMSSEDALDAFEELFNLHAELASVSGEVRKRIADEYATIAKRLDIPKKIVKHEFALEKHRRETVRKEADFDGRDRDALMKLAQIFGEDTPFGQFAARAANNAKRDDFGGANDNADGEDEGQEGEGPEDDGADETEEETQRETEGAEA